MKQTPERLALAHAYSTCLGHAEALQEALVDLHQRDLHELEWNKLAKEDRRLLDQFAYRYTRIQDDMGTRLMPAILCALEEDIAAMPVVDRLNRLEQLGWLPSAAEWSELRRIRNAFAHDYPETPAERHAQWRLAIAAAEQVFDHTGWICHPYAHSAAGLNPMRLSPEQIAQLCQNAAENLGQETGSPCGHIL